MKTYLRPLKIVCIVVFMMSCTRSQALNIVGVFLGGTPPTNSVGSGNITNIFTAASKVWELAIQDNFTVILYYSWTNSGGGEHLLISQGGTPNRETEGQIWLNNDNNPNQYSFYLDPTPLQNEEYTYYSEESTNLGDGPINAQRLYDGGTLFPGGQIDLQTVIEHEIGHSLGMSFDNYSFQQECDVDFDIDVKPPLPYAGTIIPMMTNADGLVSHIARVADRTLMSSSPGEGQRVYPSTLDILAMAQLEGFTNLNLNLLPRLSQSQPFVIAIQDPNHPNNPRKTINVEAMTLRWIQPIHDWKLEESADLKNWSTVTNAYSSDITPTGTHEVTVPVDSVGKFFRLEKINDGM